MATRTRTRTNMGWLKMFSYIAVMLLGLGITLGVVFGWIDGMQAVGNWIKNIALLFALPIPMFLSYYEAWSKRTVWRVLWVIAIILIIVFYILGLIPF